MHSIDEMAIIDVDTHFTEPRDLWTSRAPARFKDRAPRVIETESGDQTWIVDEDVGLGPPGFCVIRRDGSKLRGRFSLPRFEDMSEASTEPKARVQWMDQHGIHAQILYPNTLGFAGNSITRVKDLALRNFCVTAYNDGIGELQAAGDERLYPQAVIPFWDLDLAVAELRRCREQFGLRGFTMTDSPQEWDLPVLHDEYWDPLWATAQELAMPVNFHIGSGGFGLSPFAGFDLPRMVAASSVSLFLNNMRCIIQLIFSGLLDRFPTLNFVSVESGIGWVPFVIEASEYQMDENMGGQGSLKLRPREYFQRQIYTSFWFERENVARTIELLGEDNVMFETDFPHPTCLYPGIREQVRHTLGDLEPRVQRKVLYETAARLYGLPLPPSAAS